MDEERYNKLENIVKGLCEFVLVYSKDDRNTFMQRLLKILNEEYNDYYKD